MKQKCKSCGNNCEGEYCFRHKPRKPLSKGSVTFKTHLLSRDDNQERINNILKQQQLFLGIWKKRKHRSEISDAHLGEEPRTIFFHHILPKEKYPQAQFDEENIILLTWEEHNQVEMDMYRYQKINELREQLLIKYNLK